MRDAAGRLGETIVLGPTPRKILFYTHALAGGGAERVWVLLASGLARRGHDVILAVDYEADANKHLLDPNVRTVTLGGSHAQSIWRLSRLLAGEKPDVSLSALSASNVKHTLAAILAGRRHQAVLSYHGYADSEPQFMAQIGFHLAAVVTRLTAATVCVSDGLLTHMRKRWRASRLVRIYNPVDVVDVIDAPASVADLRARGPRVLAAGRLVGYKNFLSLVRAFARVRTPGAQLTILGEGPERAALEREIVATGQSGRITLKGYVNEAWGFFAEAACFVLPSRTESFGLVVVEALANGLPVVATHCHGPAEILDGGRYGALVPIDDEAALTAAIEQALSDPGDPGPRRQRAAEYSMKRGLDAYQDLIESLTPSRNVTSALTPRRDDARTTAPTAG